MGAPASTVAVVSGLPAEADGDALVVEAELADALADALPDEDAVDVLGDADAADEVDVLAEAPLLADDDAPPPPPQATKIGKSSASSNPVLRCVRDIFLDS